MNYQDCFAYSDLIPTINVMDANCHLSLLSPSVWLCRAFWLQILAAPSYPSDLGTGEGRQNKVIPYVLPLREHKGG